MKPAPHTRIAIYLLLAAGVAVSLYLAFSHYRVFTDITHQSFCAISKSLNCDTVSTSAFSLFLGVPVAVWGIVGYGVFLWLFLLYDAHPERRRRPGLFLVFLSALFCLVSLGMAAVSTFLIESYCIMCMVLYGVNFGLLIASYLRVRRLRGCRPFCTRVKSEFRMLFKERPGQVRLVGTAVVALLLILLYPAYWRLDAAAGLGELPKGVTEDGHPYIGAEAPRLTLIEFTDYQCFQCKKMHYMLRRLMAAHPDRLRLVHRHFPMDHKVNPLLKEPYHTGAGTMAMLAIHAQEKGKFWEMNDALFTLDPAQKEWQIAEILEKAGLSRETPMQAIFSDAVWTKLREDIKAGLEKEITGTPGYVIEGKVYIGQIPKDLLKKALNGE